MTRSLLTRRSLGGAAAVIALGLGGASVAWACSTQPTVRVEERGKAGAPQQTSGPVGSQITFTGRDFGPGPVQVRWDSRTGHLLGEAQGPNFALPVTIPQASVGVHYIVAFQTVGTATASLAFEVTPSRSASSEPDAGSTTSAATGGSEEQSSDSSSTPQSAVDDSTATTGSPAQATTGSSGSESTGTAVSSAPVGSEPAQVAPTQAPAPARATTTSGSGGAVAETSTRPASANPAVVTTPTGQAVFGGSTAAPLSAGAPSTATVSGDTWSGFGSQAKPSLLSEGLPTSSSAPTSAPAVGIGLLGAGLVALFAGFAAAESARKRAVAAGGAR